jgi:hypothetical protein
VRRRGLLLRSILTLERNYMATALDDDQTFKMITICKDAEERLASNGMPELDADLKEMIEILEKSLGGPEAYKKRLEDIEKEDKEKRDTELRKTDKLREEDEEKAKDAAFLRKELKVLGNIRQKEPPVPAEEEPKVKPVPPVVHPIGHKK